MLKYGEGQRVGFALSTSLITMIRLSSDLDLDL